MEGRVVYEIMERAWPEIANDESMPGYIQEYGRICVDTPKVLVSRTRTDAGFNTSVVGGVDAIDKLAGVRAATDGDIGVGGATLATQLLAAGHGPHYLQPDLASTGCMPPTATTSSG
ncbi:MAG: hypothetical protein WED83_02155 [Acidimicrobiia bacterium]